MPPHRKHPPAPGSVVTCPFCCSQRTSVQWKDRDLDFLQRIVRHRMCKDCGKPFETRQPTEQVTRKIRVLAS